MTASSCGWSKAHVTEKDHISIPETEINIKRYIFFSETSSWVDDE